MAGDSLAVALPSAVASQSVAAFPFAAVFPVVAVSIAVAVFIIAAFLAADYLFEFSMHSDFFKSPAFPFFPA